MSWEFFWKNKSSLSLSFCLGFSLLCIFWQNNPFSEKIGFLGRFADRISGLMNSGLRFTGTLWVELDKYRTLEQRYKQAQKLLEEYRLEKDKFDLIVRQNEYLREALSLRPLTNYPEVRSEVLGVRLNSISPRIIIGKGKEAGIRPLMPVIARTHDHKQNFVSSVVGLTVISDASIAVVQPLIHPNFQIGVRIENSQEWAILSGNSGRPNEVLLTYITTDFSPERAIVTQSDVPLIKNAQVYTSGAGGIFPPGIPIGLVSGTGQRRNDFKTAYVQPFAQISQLNYVSIILKEVEGWSDTWDQQLRWKEHLETEFGHPEYPELTQDKKIKAPKPQPASGKKTKSDKPAPPKPIRVSPSKQPRRIQNLKRVNER